MVEMVAFVIFVMGIFAAIVWTIRQDPEADARKKKARPFQQKTPPNAIGRKPDA